ncbi:MAG: DUF481 domain-containing protein [Verrucomicrobiae bacterium]|nr:DUF481 domain-containing protein [Verrucomicrobiae bacterium]
MPRLRPPDPPRIHAGRVWMVLAVWWMVCLGNAAAAAEPVILLLKNGDRISGEVVSTNANRIVIRSPFTGRIPVPREHIRRITSESELAQEAAAAVAAAEAPAKEAATPVATTEAPESPVPPPPPPPPPATPIQPSSPPAVAAASPLAPTNAVPATPLIPGWFTGIWTNWHGNLQAGLNMGMGTTDRLNIYLNSSASKKWGRTVSSVTYNVSYGEVNGVPNANIMAGTVKVDVELSPNRRLYTYTQGAAGYDVIRKIELEYLVGGGFGYRIMDKPKRVLAVELGAQYQEFNYTVGNDLTTVALRLGQNFNTSIEKLSVNQRFGFTPSFDEFSNYQFNFALTLSYPLFKPLTINLNVINQYLSRPATGVQNNDLQVQTTLGVTF